ncbi:MAG: SDR family NAD(P)-dependent oxidoreductase [Gammaproteobacteria bacterium]
MANRLLIVVGAGPGISLATARRFGAEGYIVGLVARRQQTLEKFRDELAAAGVRTIYRVADCTCDADLSAALKEIQVEAGLPADVLLYNAANIKWKELLSETAPALVADFAVNVAGALTAVQAVLPALRAANRGTLLFTGSSFSANPVPAFGSLSIGKAGLRSLAHSVAKSLDKTAIRVHYLSIQGRVTPEDPQRSPDAIAERCWQLHAGAARSAATDVEI